LKFGTENMNFSFKVNLRSYERAHVSRKCVGSFRIGFTIDAFYSSSALGPIKLPCIPQVMCHECGAAYTVPGFEEWIEEVIVRHLVLSKEGLNKKQVKFLRQYFGYTQEELAEKIGLAGGKSELSKMETESSMRSMSPDKQVRMKLHFAKLLKIKDADKLFIVNEIDDSKTVQVDPHWFPGKKELEKKFKTG